MMLSFVGLIVCLMVLVFVWDVAGRPMPTRLFRRRKRKRDRIFF